jgi:hypothetical protein
MLQRAAPLGSGQEFVLATHGGGGLHVVTPPIGPGGDATLAAGCFATPSNQNGKAAAEYRANQAATSAVAGRRRETKVHGDCAADN